MSNRAFQQHDHQRCIDQALRDARRLCKQRKVKLTPLRASVLALVWRSHQALGAYPLMDLLRQKRLEEEGANKLIAPPTVYRVLDFLQQQGLIHRLATLNAYIGCEHPAQQHNGCFLICADCHNTEELPDTELSSAIDNLAQSDGFCVQHAAVEVVGLCAGCQESTT
jgi:Fur family zinc uptake transcriptional regulator